MPSSLSQRSDSAALRWRTAWLTGAWLAVGLVVFLSLAPGLPASGHTYGDKIGHALAYATLALGFASLYPRPRESAIGLGLLALGAALEGLQHLAPERYFELADLLANAVGVGLGLLAARLTHGRLLNRLESALGLAHNPQA